MNLNKIIPLLQTSKPIEILKKIVAFNEANEIDAIRARVRMGLTSGFSLEGIPLKIDVDGNTVLISEHNSISYTNANALAGIEILNPEALLEILTGGSYFNVPQEDVPTNLQLKRAFKAEADEIESSYGFKIISEVLDDGLPTGVEKYQFGQFLKLLQETIALLAQDSLGKEALTAVGEITITSVEEPLSYTKTSNGLTIGVNFKNKFSNDFKVRLKAGFESNL